jgi:hypothetical protein
MSKVTITLHEVARISVEQIDHGSFHVMRFICWGDDGTELGEFSAFNAAAPALEEPTAPRKADEPNFF